MNGLGLPVKLILSPGQDADVTHAPALLEGSDPEVVIADKGYDSRKLVDAIEEGGAEAVIPTRKNVKAQRGIDPDLYRERNLVERFWARLEQSRRVATQGEKTSRDFLAFAHLCSTTILLR